MITSKFLIGSLSISMLLSSALYGGRSVSSANSTIDFPHDQSYINTGQPTVIGTLRDDKNNPVTNEAVSILINGNEVGTVVSDVDGIYRLLIDPGLADGQYQLSIFCVDSQSTVESNQFNIDTTFPSIAIAYPQDGYVIANNTIIISGTTEENAMINIFLDANAFGDVCYADENGNWSIEYDDLENGAHTITAQATDIAGNQGDLSDVTNFSVNA